MAKEILVGQLLTQELLDAGEKLLKQIRATDLQIIAAFWIYHSEAEQWRLVLVSPRLDKEGPRKLYSKLSELLYSGTELSLGLGLQNVTLLSPNDKLVQALAGANQNYKQSMGYDLSGQRLPDIYLNGSYVADLYLYFINDSIKPVQGTSWTI